MESSTLLSKQKQPQLHIANALSKSTTTTSTNSTSCNWANVQELWMCMVEKDATYSKLRSEKLLSNHPSLVESYRTILYDWLSEVAHECKFHRETYHLAIDFTDRYLAAQTNVGKLQLQLIGVTCLFLASKYEEIRPPTVTEFADLTDGACKPEDIINYEIVILSAINWNIAPMTPNNWLSVYMQILLNLDNNDADDDFNDDNQQQQDVQQDKKEDKQVIRRQLRLRCENNNINNDNTNDSSNPQLNSKSLENGFNDCKRNLTSKNLFISSTTSTTNGIFKTNHKRISSVIDLALLHIGTLRFSNSVITASALYHFTDEETILLCTGFKYSELAECVKWLRPFVETIRDIREPVFMANCRTDVDSTQIHTHIANAKLLEKVSAKIEAELISQVIVKRKACCLVEDDLVTDSDCESITNYSPNKPTTLLTPPRSARKSRRIQT